MSAYELETVLKKWKRGDLSVEQAVGQLMLLLEALSARVGSLERKLLEARPSSTKPLSEEGK